MNVELSAEEARRAVTAIETALQATHFKRDRRSEYLDSQTAQRIAAMEDAENAALRELRHKIKYHLEEA